MGIKLMGHASWGRVRAVLLAMAGVLALHATTAAAQAPSTRAARPADSSPVAADTDGNRFAVSVFHIRYNQPSPQLPSPDELMQVPIELGQTSSGYVVRPSQRELWLQALYPEGEPVAVSRKPAPNATPVHTTLAALSRSTHEYYYSAIWSIERQVFEYLNSRGFIGIVVQHDSGQISPLDYGTDQRKGGTGLDIVIYSGHVSELRTIASGKRVPASARVNNPVHQWIKEQSPVKAAAHEVLRRDLLDDYLFLLNRQAGRHVDVAVSAASPTEPGAVVLDYLVTETKDWSVYTQVSNTGTSQTDPWRERFGFVSYQLTNRDDIFSVDYNTAGFVKSQDVNLSYDMPLSLPARQRARMFGDYNQFTASDVGQSHENFGGMQYTFGGELAANVVQKRDLFVDLVVGGRYEHDYVHNPTASGSGRADFAVPYGGVRFQRTTDVSATAADAMVVGRLTGSGQRTLDNLARVSTDAQAALLQASGTSSFFLEPLVNNAAFEAAKSTLAHEMFLSLRAQYAFDYRLIPTAQEVAGGMFSVRGYPESIMAGDTVVVGTAEYRFHLPRNLKAVEPDQNFKPFGQPFKFAPQQPYGRPDWDLILRAFVDAGRTINNQRQQISEQNATLVGTGVGAEFDLQQNLMLRVDWGIALQSIPGQVSAGSNRFYFSATFLY